MHTTWQRIYNMVRYAYLNLTYHGFSILLRDDSTDKRGEEYVRGYLVCLVRLSANLFTPIPPVPSHTHLHV